MKGFTLIEILVALAISALLAVMAYGGLNTILETRKQTDLSATRLQQVQKAFMWLKRDVEQAVVRPVRDEYGDPQPAFMASEHGRFRLELTRGGYYNPGIARSSLQRVAYSLEENSLQRLTWPYLDRAIDTEPVATELLENVNAIDFRFVDMNGDDFTSWPSPSPKTGTITQIPQAVEITLELEDWGRLTRLFLLAGQ